jgi:hypothetical protein
MIQFSNFKFKKIILDQTTNDHIDLEYKSLEFDLLRVLYIMQFLFKKKFQIFIFFTSN